MSKREREKLALLVVDDDPGHRYLIERTLREQIRDADIVAVGTRRELINCIRQRNFDCVLLDFNLGECQADLLLADLAQHRPHCPAIVISGCRDQETVIASMRNGSCDFIQKDHILIDGLLWDRVQVAINRRKKERRERRRMQRRHRRLLELAATDPLTGLLNRRTITELMERNGRQVHDRRGTISVVMMDLDHFKQVNDTWGHQVGDNFLLLMASVISSFTTGSDVAARWGGEEFLVIRHQTSLAQAVRWAETLRADVARQTVNIGTQAVGTTVSVGVATVPSPAFGRNTIARADEALYLAKHRGRNRVCTADMVAFQKIVTSLKEVTPSKRLQEALAVRGAALGPVQREHITEHSRRVSETAVALGRHLGFEGKFLEKVRLAALYHDIGKFLIPEDVLSKRDRLTPAEHMLISRHVEDAAEMAGMLGVEKEIVDYIRFHHCRYDQQKWDNRTPVGARLVSVADALDAMTSPRPYHEVRSRANALLELRRERGRQFDPAVVDAAVRAWRDVALPATDSVEGNVSLT